MTRNFLSQKELACLLNVKTRTLKNWIYEKNTLPEEKYKKLIKIEPSLQKFNLWIIKFLDKNWGAIKGGQKVIENVDLKKKMFLLRKKKEIKRNNKIKFKKKKINYFLKKSIDPKKVLAIALLTDGSLSPKDNYRISFYTKDQKLKKLLFGIIDYLSIFHPSIYFDRKKQGYLIRLSDRKLAKKLLDLCPNYKTAPSLNQKIKEYFDEPQPNIQFLNKANINTQIFCLKMAFSCDGSISLNKNGGYELNLSCYHPLLCLEWQKFLKKFKINGKIGKDKKAWGEVDGIRIYDRKSISNFLKLGGFIEGVKISNKSNIYKCIEKNKLLKELVKKWPRSLAWQSTRALNCGETDKPKLKL